MKDQVVNGFIHENDVDTTMCPPSYSTVLKVISEKGSS